MYVKIVDYRAKGSRKEGDPFPNTTLIECDEVEYEGDEECSCLVLHAVKYDARSIPSVRRIITPGQAVFIMNTEGKTIDSIGCS